MPSKEELRQLVRARLDQVIAHVNATLRGEHLESIEPVLSRIGRGGQLPHWYERLKHDHTLPNLDGKTIGSVVEMLLLGVLETSTFAGLGLPPLKINPARGVDLPDLDLGVKSPSENYCTSEPFFSAYQRLIGSDHDALVLLTDYQTAKRNPPLRLQIIRWRYLTRTQIADEGLCRVARKHRDWLVRENVAWAQKVVRFLAFVNQSDWRAKQLVKILDALPEEAAVRNLFARAKADFAKQNRQRLRKDRPPLPDADLEALERVATVRPLHLGVIDAADNWVVEVQKDLARLPNDNEWQRFLASPLDGLIGMSFALQWRYNFGRLFGAREAEGEDETC
jgi:hypothetical protein